MSGAGQTPAVLIPSLVDRTPPKAPTSLRAAITGTRVALSWKNPKAGVAKVTVVWNSKRAPRSTKDGKAVYRGAGTHFVLNLKKLPAGKHVRFAVFALDGAGNVSAAARATLSVPVPSPLSLAPDGKLSGSPALTWNAVKGATYYNVQVFEGTQATKRVAVAWPAGTSWTLPGADLKKGKHVHVVRLARSRSEGGGALRDADRQGHVHVHGVGTTPAIEPDERPE